jgi:hypothetical protein
MGNVMSDTDRNLVKSGDAMVTAGGLLALGETVTTAVTLGVVAVTGERRVAAALGAVGSVITLGLGARVFDLKCRGLA